MATTKPKAECQACAGSGYVWQRAPGVKGEVKMACWQCARELARLLGAATRIDVNRCNAKCLFCERWAGEHYCEHPLIAYKKGVDRRLPDGCNDIPTWCPLREGPVVIALSASALRSQL